MTMTKRFANDDGVPISTDGDDCSTTKKTNNRFKKIYYIPNSNVKYKYNKSASGILLTAVYYY